MGLDFALAFLTTIAKGSRFVEAQPTNNVTLRPVTRENWQEALNLAARPEQQRFVAGYAPVALLGLAKAYVRPGGVSWEPYAIYARETGEASEPAETMVGFVELAYESGCADEYWVFHFFIDARFQGRGYGRAALARLTERVAREHPAARALQLVVHPQNTAAQRLYTSAGFRPTGEERWGEPAYRLELDTARGVASGDSGLPKRHVSTRYRIALLAGYFMRYTSSNHPVDPV